MVRPERQMTHTLKAAGGLAAATLALALLISCASRPLATPTAPIVVPTPTPMPAPASPEPGAGRILSPRRPPLPAARRLPASPGRVLLTAADGYIADGEGLSPFATDYPAVGNLDPELLAAVQHASTDAARDGVALIITSGWRSVRYQQSLLDAASAQYGSEAGARMHALRHHATAGKDAPGAPMCATRPGKRETAWR